MDKYTSLPHLPVWFIEEGHSSLRVATGDVIAFPYKDTLSGTGISPRPFCGSEECPLETLPMKRMVTVSEKFSVVASMTCRLLMNVVYDTQRMSHK